MDQNTRRGGPSCFGASVMVFELKGFAEPGRLGPCGPLSWRWNMEVEFRQLVEDTKFPRPSQNTYCRCQVSLRSRTIFRMPPTPMNAGWFSDGVRGRKRWRGR